MFSQPSLKQSQSGVIDDVIEPPNWQGQVSTALPAQEEESRRLFAKLRDHDWMVAVLYTTCDIVCWVLLYGLVGYIRRDAFFVSPFEFVLVDLVTLGVLLQALYVIGGYNRNTEMRGLTYTTEHILGIAGAAAVSSLLIYSAATFDHSIRQSRG